MTAGITHVFVSGIADGGDATLVRPSNWNAAHALTWSTASLAISDPLTRFTVTDAGVGTGSQILFSIRRATITDALDIYGWVYSGNVLTVAAGSFDILVSAQLWGADEALDFQPSETLTLVYAVG